METVASVLRIVQTARMSRIFLRSLLAEVVVIFMVIAVFRLIESRLIAGAVAGTVFIALGVFVLTPGLRNREYRRSKTFVAGCLHLFLSALPLFVTRLLNAATDFQNVSVLGMPGPIFHRVSTGIYVLLLIATILDWIQSRKKDRVAA